MGVNKGQIVKNLFATAIFSAVLLAGSATASMAAGLIAHVDIGAQRMTVTSDGQFLYSWPVSTARTGYSTPRGTYKPTRLNRMWYSHKYDMSPMPYSVFFKGGYAVHGTGYVRQLGRPASHGCVRLATANAARFFNLVQQHGSKNVRIVLTN